MVGQADKELGEAYLLGGDTVRAKEAFLSSLDELAQIAHEAHSFWSLLGLARIALRERQAETAHEFLNQAGAVIEGRQDSYEQARWWQVSGRLSLLQNKPAKARQALDRALAYSQQVDDMAIVRTIVEFAYLYQTQSDLQGAARLLGFVQSQATLEAGLVQWRIKPLLESLAAALDEQELSLLLEDGAKLDRQAIIDNLI